MCCMKDSDVCGKSVLCKLTILSQPQNQIEQKQTTLPRNWMVIFQIKLTRMTGHHDMEEAAQTK